MEETNNVANYADREAFNKKVFDDELTGGKNLVRYTWIYRWEASSYQRKEDSSLQSGRCEERTMNKRGIY